MVYWWFLVFVVAASAIWVFIDARQIGVKKGQLGGVANMGPIGWSIATLLLWIVSFPVYLIKRPQFLRINGKPPGRSNQVSIIGAALVALVLTVTVLLYTGRIGVSTDQIRTSVEESIRTTFAADPRFAGVTIRNFSLKHVDGNQYEGILDATSAVGYEQVVVDVVVERGQFNWKIRPSQ